MKIIYLNQWKQKLNSNQHRKQCINWWLGNMIIKNTCFILIPKQSYVLKSIYQETVSDAMVFFFFWKFIIFTTMYISDNYFLITKQKYNVSLLCNQTNPQNVAKILNFWIFLVHTSLLNATQPDVTNTNSRGQSSDYNTQWRLTPKHRHFNDKKPQTQLWRRTRLENPIIYGLGSSGNL